MRTSYGVDEEWRISGVRKTLVDRTGLNAASYGIDAVVPDLCGLNNVSGNKKLSEIRGD